VRFSLATPKNAAESFPTGNLRDILAWIAAFHSNEARTYSQNGEDGVIQHILSMIPASSEKYYAEFGTENGDVINTRFLRERQGWKGLLLDGSHSNPGINLVQSYISVNNIVGLFKENKVPKDLDLLSVDIDCFDFWVTKVLLEAGYKPRIIVNEVNAGLPFAPPVSLTVPDPRTTTNNRQPGRGSGGLFGDCGGDDYFGASVSAYWHLYRKFGYSMVYCERTGTRS
jgi:hypothetical protein